jgi:hypothetical protein
MARHTYVVFTNPIEGRDDDFNDWYDNTHLNDVLQVEGFVAAQRFKLAETDPPQKFPHRYLALYEVESDDLGKAAQALSEAAKSGAMFVSDSLNGTDALAKYFTPITDRRTAD